MKEIVVIEMMARDGVCIATKNDKGVVVRMLRRGEARRGEASTVK